MVEKPIDAILLGESGLLGPNVYIVEIIVSDLISGSRNAFSFSIKKRRFAKIIPVGESFSPNTILFR